MLLGTAVKSSRDLCRCDLGDYAAFAYKKRLRTPLTYLR